MNRSALACLAFALTVTAAMAQDSAPNPAGGKTLWEGPNTQCRNCHGKLGEGGLGPDLAGRGLSAAEFQQAVRKPWGIMPAFTTDQVSDAEIANMAAYFASLPKVAEPGPWRFTAKDDAKIGQKTALAIGCAQCHGPTLDIARGILGGRDVSFERFRDLVYDHTVEMPKLGTPEGNTPGERLHMGNYNSLRVSEAQLKAIYDWAKNDLGFHPDLEARLTSGGSDASGATYNLNVSNVGVKPQGLVAQDVTIDVVLPAGASVVRAGGDGYKGVHADADAKADVAEWKLPRLAPTDTKSLTLTLAAPAGSGNPKGSLRWVKPAPKSDAVRNVVNFGLRMGG